MSTFPNPVDHVPLNVDEIQGNILAGFSKDHQRFLFLRIDDVAKAKTWLRTLVNSGQVATTKQVKAFNDGFKAAAKQHGEVPGKMPTATWLNIAFNFPGLQALGVSAKDFPPDFTEGMAARNKTIGDVGRSAPDQWDPWLQDRSSLHVMLLLAADLPADLEAKLITLQQSLPGSGLTLIHIEQG
jgi:hypothetical protein